MTHITANGNREFGIHLVPMHIPLTRTRKCARRETGETVAMEEPRDIVPHMWIVITNYLYFFFFRNYFKVDTCSRLQITNHLSEIITFQLQVAVRKQNGLFATAAVIISEMFAPLVNQIVRYKRSYCKRRWSWLGGGGNETGKLGIKEVDR